MINDTSVGSSDSNNAAGETAVSSQAEAIPGFDSFGLSPELLRAIGDAGYKAPTPIQAKGIPPAMARRDLIGIAQTGTGKTASFALPMIELLSRGRARARMPRSLILEPTRELAAQVAEGFDQFTKYHKLSQALLIGGTSFEEQDRKLDRGADILIATPGRLLDHFERGKLMLTQVQILVIDEADRMLDMGFIPDIERICKLIPFTRQTLFYSATMPTEIRRLTEMFLQNPVRVEVARPATTAENIAQSVIDVPANDWAKREALRRLIREAGDIRNAIVFCNRKHDVDIVARSLQKHGFNAGPLHGDLDQSVRTRTLESFRSGDLQILVASDVAARGLDIPDVSHVFNFDVPYHPDDYVHRVGRTGRAGRHGTAFMLVSPRDEKYLEAVEQLTKSKLPRRTLEGLAEAVQDRPPRRGRDERRGDRRGRHDHRDRPVKPHGQVAAMEPIHPARHDDRPAPVPAAPNPRSDRPQRPERSERPAQRDASRTQPHAARKPEPFSANLDQLPAFLLRPVPLPKPDSEEKRAEKKPVRKPVAKAPPAKPVPAKPMPAQPSAVPAPEMPVSEKPVSVTPVSVTPVSVTPVPAPAAPAESVPAAQADAPKPVPARKRAAKKPAIPVAGADSDAQAASKPVRKRAPRKTASASAQEPVADGPAAAKPAAAKKKPAARKSAAKPDAKSDAKSGAEPAAQSVDKAPADKAPVDKTPVDKTLVDKAPAKKTAAKKAAGPKSGARKSAASRKKSAAPGETE